ncbi:YchE family NAAT transporter [soil metagenome]
MSSFFFVCLTTIATIVNPFSALAPFLAMTHGETHDRRARTARRAAIVSTCILAGCAAAGGFIFRFYGITLPALKVAGGVLLFFVSFDMINARASRTKSTEDEQREGAAKDEVAIFPIAIPLLSGPGAIVSVFMLSDQAHGMMEAMALYAAIAFVGLGSYLTLKEAPRISDRIGRIGMNVISRLMGLVLATMSAQFIIDGLSAALPGLTLAK